MNTGGEKDLPAVAALSEMSVFLGSGSSRRVAPE
jgi:hypothetical protein